jgi:hypothetical protein
VAIYSQDVKTGDVALAFIGRRPNHTVIAKERHEYLFALSGGFFLLNELIKTGDQRANATALAAIRQSANVVKSSSATFPDEALMPFCRLLEARDPQVRWWAFRVIRFAPTSPEI